MNVLLLGGGGREHALAWKLRQSPRLGRLFIAPGNPGTATCGDNIPLNPLDFPTVISFIRQEKIDMVVVGPEEPLVRGIYDTLRAEPDLASLPVIGPSATGAQLEGSKAYAKEFMAAYDIPTAGYREFTRETLAAGLEYLASQPGPYVLKADGLAAGKGVVILDDVTQAQAELTAMLDGKFGTASERVVIEQFLSGIEFSVFVLTDGKDYVVLPEAKDYKRIGEGDTGLNTGGMGAVSPVSFVDAELMEKVRTRIIEPTLRGIQERSIDYHGFIFLGLIVVAGEPFVIEYNCRLGDPETEVVLPRLENDLLDLLTAVHEGNLAQQVIHHDPRAAATVIMVSGGYPEAYAKGKKISGLSQVAGTLVFHAGTAQTADGSIVTSGGRVLALTSYATDFRTAVAHSLQQAGRIQFEGQYFRRDIGFDL